MAIIKCKMCGGDVDISADKTCGICEYCGCTMTFPKVSDEQRAAAFNRGNHFRRSGEFDKALAVYERIVAEDDTDAEAHWCCALCRFGIEYVEDPATYEWLPTCHRASFDSFLEDVDYLAAVEHSDGITRRQYVKDGAKIAEVQRGILATSQSTEPYDVFISYKELDANGNRTRDSILAQDIYYQLTEQGRRVFFSRITLEDIPGTEYEPYIFAALNSAKVMIVVGTSAENLNAVWVKNEWSRYLAMMRKDRSKLLLPCYRDMDPYDLPEQLSVLMSYDMGKIGFIQDLIRGVNKVLDADKKETPATVQPTVVQQVVEGGKNAEALLKRGYMALEDGEWQKADGFFEEVLNQNAECGEAYLGKLLARERMHGLAAWVSAQKEKNNTPAVSERLEACPADEKHIRGKAKELAVEGYLTEKEITLLYDYDRSYVSTIACRRSQKDKQLAALAGDRLLSRAKQYATGTFKQQLEAALGELTAALDARIEDARENSNRNAEQVKAAYAAHLAAADAKAAQRNEEACARREADYQAAVAQMEKASTAAQYSSAIAAMKKPRAYKDCEERITQCLQTVERLQAEQRQEEARQKELRKQEEARQAEVRKQAEEQKAKKTEKLLLYIAVFSLVFAVAMCLASWVNLANHYKDAVALMENGQYEEAYTAFSDLGGYKDSQAQSAVCRKYINEASYAEATALMENGQYEEAYTAFSALGKYKDSKAMKEACETAIKDNAYAEAAALMESGHYEEAIAAFEALDGYNDSAEQISVCLKDIAYDEALALKDAGQYEEAIAAFEALDGYKDSAKQITAIKDTTYTGAVSLMESGAYEEAIEAFSALGSYKDSAGLLEKCYIESYGEETGQLLMSLKVGSTYTFGTYEQDNNKKNGQEEIEWLILEKEGSRILLISKYALDSKDYNSKSGGCTWTGSSLRSWLNGEFLTTAFSEAEQAMLSPVPRSGGDKDRAFILGSYEAELYFVNDEARKCVPTAYAKAQGALEKDGYNKGGVATCCWWLRSPSNAADIVGWGGAVYCGGNDFNASGCGVRPAIWIDLAS